ncbi:hypothetical protein OROGR_013633 [Orobanche gracilis]
MEKFDFFLSHLDTAIDGIFDSSCQWDVLDVPVPPPPSSPVLAALIAAATAQPPDLDPAAPVSQPPCLMTAATADHHSSTTDPPPLPPFSSSEPPPLRSTPLRDESSRCIFSGVRGAPATQRSSTTHSHIALSAATQFGPSDKSTTLPPYTSHPITNPHRSTVAAININAAPPPGSMKPPSHRDSVAARGVSAPRWSVDPRPSASTNQTAAAPTDRPPCTPLPCSSSPPQQEKHRWGLRRSTIVEDDCANVPAVAAALVTVGSSPSFVMEKYIGPQHSISGKRPDVNHFIGPVYFSWPNINNYYFFIKNNSYFGISRESPRVYRLKIFGQVRTADLFEVKDRVRLIGFDFPGDERIFDSVILLEIRFIQIRGRIFSKRKRMM